MNCPNSFYLSDSEVLFFNIFIKNSKIYIITPINKTHKIAQDNFKVSYGSIQLNLLETITKSAYEPTQILIYDFPHADKENYEITVQYKNILKQFVLCNEISNKNKKLSITTLFKTDYTLIPIFYDYYKRQGVEHFYLYYNGVITNEIQKYCTYNEITLIEWNFPYGSTNAEFSSHYAQLGQMHDALYRFGKDNSEYMIFCDLDEYMYGGKQTLIDLTKDSTVDSFGFCNVWANTVNNIIPERIPKTLKIGDKKDFPKRSKCIHKTEKIVLLNIHSASKFNQKIKNKNDYIMFHFHHWGGEDVKEFPTDKTIHIN